MSGLTVRPQHRLCFMHINQPHRLMLTPMTNSMYATGSFGSHNVHLWEGMLTRPLCHQTLSYSILDRPRFNRPYASCAEFTYLPFGKSDYLFLNMVSKPLIQANAPRQATIVDPHFLIKMKSVTMTI